MARVPAGGTGAIGSKPPQPGFSLTTTTLVMLLGVTLFTIFAGISDDTGKLTVVIMWGLLLGWALLHQSQLSSMVKAI